jgi:hypothetical protein
VRRRALAAVLLVLALTGCSDDDPYGGFDHPRTLHVAPDGRLIVTDLGTGKTDGQVVAIAPDGTVCAVIGDALVEGAGFGTMRCSDGRVVDLEGFERRANPDGRKLESNPYDIVSDRGDGWYVSDAAGNSVLHIGPDGEPEVVAVTPMLEPFSGRKIVQGVPTGLAMGDDGRVRVALFGGAPYGDGTGALLALTPAAGGGRAEVAVEARAPYPLGVLPVPGGLAVLSIGDDFRAETSGRVLLVPPGGGTPRAIAEGLARPTGFARLADGTFVVAEENAGRVRVAGR